MDAFIFIVFEQKFLSANTVDSDQKSHSVASDLGLHCLHMSQKWVSNLERVKTVNTYRGNNLSFHSHFEKH